MRQGASNSAGYFALRLHRQSEASWAVVSAGTGAIAVDRDERLVMRLTESEAKRIAAELTAAERAKDGQSE